MPDATGHRWSARHLAARCVRLFVLVALLLASVGPVWLAGLGALAQESDESVPAILERWDGEARLIERRLEFDPPRSDEIPRKLTAVGDQLEIVPSLRERINGELKPLQEQLQALGETPEDPSTEAPQISLDRKRLQGEITLLEGYAKRIEQAEARARGLEANLTKLRRDRFTEQLVARGPSVLDTSVIERGLEDIARTTVAIWTETQLRMSRLTVNAVTIGRIVLPILLLAGALGLLFQVKRGFLVWLLRRGGPDQRHARRVVVGIGILLARLLLPASALLMTLTALQVSGLFGEQGLLVLDGLVDAAFLVIGAYALGGAYFAPHTPSLRLSSLAEDEAERAHRKLIMLAAVVGLDSAMVVQGEALGLSLDALALLNVVITILGGLALWRFIAVAGRSRPAPEEAQADADDDPADPEGDLETRSEQNAVSLTVRLLRLVGQLAAMAAPALALLGYYAAARYVFYPFVFSGALVGVCLLLFHVAQSFVQNAGERTGRHQVAASRLQLIPILLAFLLACAATPLLALIWGVAPSDLEVAWRRLLEGFKLGEVVISPIDFLLFLLVVVVGFLLTGRFKRLLRHRVLPLTGLDTGGRDAIAAGAGYLGLVVTVLVAISATGVDLSNLAIVAGALSVGIGFGLQNIVNNFVSGIILLIERPIKAGDWIELPSGMGYVKTINVRSTEVETFDRASLFVPNSQLISENVINWTHSNLNGRVIVKVGVDYSSDPRKVERILQEIARGHPLMLRRPAPYVLFRGFGADSLDFEIRGVLRDVNWMLNVQSDINFEIARRFKEEGISIPFRQADIELKNPEQVATAIRLALDNRTRPPDEEASSQDERPAARAKRAAGKEDLDNGPGDGVDGDR
ncbi:MAG: DUF3772 domain-containing protein [Pseudomonadota bacterium]